MIKIPQEVREAAARLERINSKESPEIVYQKKFSAYGSGCSIWLNDAIAKSAISDDYACIGEFFLPIILSGAIPSQEVIDAIRTLVDDADYDERESIGRAADTLHEWIDKIEQEEES